MTEFIEQGFRSSPQQCRVWRLQKHGPAWSPILCALRIEGDLDRRALRRALAATVARHEILRTAFRLPAGLSRPLQVILEPGPVPLPEVDFRGLSPERRSAGATALLCALGSPPFDLERGAGWRAALVRLGPREHEMLFALSAACADPGALKPLAADLLAAYAHQVAGGEHDSEPPLQYADVAEWQNNLLETEDAAEGIEIWREHWRRHDIDARIALPLPLEEREAASGPFTPQEVAVPVARETTGALARIAEVWGCPPQVLILTAWKAVIQRGTGRDETLVGVLYPGRDAEELRRVVGPLARYLPIAACFSPESSLREAVAQVRQAMEEAEPWGEYFSWDHVAGNGHGAGGFPVCFETAANDWELAVDGLRVAPVRHSGNSAVLDSFSLALSCTGEGESLRLALRYDPRRFRREAARRLAGRLAALLGSVAVRPEASLAVHPAIPEDELGRWLEVSIAQPAADRSREGKTLAAVFEEQVDRAPDRLAVVAGDGHLTFRELDVRANRLAHHLRTAGAGPEVPVVLCLGRSADAVTAILAVWKAGAFYVPLDPTQPAERLAFLLADTAAPFLVTDSRLASGLPREEDLLPGVRTVRLDEEAASIALRPADRPAGEAYPQSLAYTIYTSGSTGRPKGVQVEHRSVLHLLAALKTAVLDPLAGVRPGSLLASLNAPMIFDASVQQLALLLTGHALCVVPQDIRADGAALLSFLRENGVDLLDCIPSQLRILVEAGFLDGQAGPRIVLTAGEAVDEPLWSRLAQAEQTICFNLYGPTECSVDATFHRIEPGSAKPTIGRPLAGYEAFLLDHPLQPVPPGAPGELCLGGTGLARGYLRRPDLTAERFVPHPFARQPGERLYRTGDLGRHLLDGSLEFLGRLDHQIKIRGFRIELGEIEAVLVERAGAREAVVVARENRSEGGAGDRRLVAYVVGNVTADALRRVLRERLPDYMVPAAFVTLAALPLTPSGKVDRNALPAPQWHGSEEDDPAPRTPVEEILAGIWVELLGLERVGAAGHFFDLGGHSLLATQVMSRLRRTFGIEMPLRTLFEAPVLADLAARIEAARRAGAVPPAPPLAAVPRGRPLPLSFAQQRLWFIDQLEPGTSLYNIPVVQRIEGPLQRAVLALCLGEIMRRHESLRTVFAAPEGSPVQVIQPEALFALPVVDLSGLAESRREALALLLAGEEGGRPFDLARGPLLRGVLLRLAEDDHVAALTMHHITSDGWSMRILVHEVMELYAAFAEGRPSPLPELPLHYADFAAWQHSWLHGEILESEISFWRRQLAGLPPLLELPTDRPRPAMQSFRGASRPVRLPAGLTRQVEALGRREGATLFMVLLAGFQIPLARYSGQQDFVVGSPVAGRNRVETEGLIGFFVNTLMLRGDLAGAPSFRELLGRVRETALSAHTHQDVPFEKLVAELAPERSLAQTPLFQVMFVLQNAPAESLEIRNLRLQPVSAAGTTAKFDLTLSLEEHNGELKGAVEYATDLFDAATIQRLLAGIERLLEVAVADPDRSVADLPLLSPAELHQVRIEWNPATAATGAFLVEMFEVWADRTPAATAVLAPGEVLTYAELDRRANQLARHLRTLGVTTDARVGLCVERSPAMIVGVLGILKAGAAYVPLDPTYPRERLAYMIEDARVPVLLIQERLLGSLPETAAVILRLDADWSEVARESGGRFPSGTTPESLAYVIYTSGSTGRPKGAMVHHRGWSNLAEAQQRLFDVRPGSHVLQFASLSFDASASEIAMSLGSGATLVLGPRERRLSAEELTALLRESTVATLPPTMLAVLSPEELPGLETLVVAGETCPPELARRWSAGRRLFNAYGPTEASVCATAKLYDGGERLPIGRPIDRVQAYVLDARMNPVPAGVAGELHVGGPGVARGYLGQPERTAWSFVPHPLATLPGERLYRTGDLAYRRPDGEIELLGRTDHQVKVRGFRIELGEVEAALLAVAGVREAAVVALEGRSDTGPGDRRLVAYVTGDVAADALRRSLQERLPDSMVPTAFVTLAALPLTPNGKVDRKALPAPDWKSAEKSYLAPRTPVEEVLTGIWAELLGLERVGAVDHFFALGGHSLLATRVMSRLRSAFNVEMPLRDLFEAPVLANLAARVEAALQAGAARSAPPLVPVTLALRQGPLPLSFAQQRLWFIDQLEPGRALYNMPVALRVEGPLDSAVLAESLGEIVRRHETLRTVFVAPEGSPAQVIQPAAPFALPVVDLSGLPERAREALALTLAGEEAARPFDLGRGPLLRGVLLRLAGGDHVLALTLHHIVSDGWSMGILVREVGALYPAFAEGRPSPLPELPVQYADFSAWQHTWLHGEILESEIAFWRRQLAGLPPRLELPTDRPRPAVQSFRGASRPVRLPVELTRQVEALGRREGATLFMVLLAGFQALLARYSGQQDLAVGTLVAGRNRVETEGLIGFFLNTLVLRSDLTGGSAGEPSFLELLGQVRETLLAAHLHQDVPFEKLVQELTPERRLSHTPLFQVMFVLQNAPVESLEIQNLCLQPLNGIRTTTNFDLTCSLTERNGGLSGTIEHVTDLFDAATIDRLIRHYERLLNAAVAAPELTVSELPLLSATEPHQLLAEWNDTAVPLAKGILLHDLFADQAARTPDAPAATFEGDTLTYAELAARVERLARHLRELDCGPESHVGVALERNLDLLVALLAVLKAGAVYVPLDPGYPRERLAFMLEDFLPAALLTQEDLRDRLPIPAGLPVVVPAALPEAAGATDLGALEDLGDDCLAYVIYTSGSTGRPKGAMVAHGGMLNHLRSKVADLGLERHSRVAQTASQCFDISVWQLLAPLLAGGSVHIAGESTVHDPDLLLRFAARERITVLEVVPSLLTGMLDSLAAAGGTIDLSSLRWLIVTGEACAPDLASRWLALAPHARLLNAYGPTECSDDVTHYRMAKPDFRPSLALPIGRPVANTRIYVLDRRRQLTVQGVVGELCVAGRGVGRGYLGLPARTAEVFVPDPFSGEPGSRLYRTGDLARWRADGTLEFLGRLDQQVKVRGFRIELGEIESALVTLAGVREAVVVAREDRSDRGPGDRRLVAYVVHDPDQDGGTEVREERVAHWSDFFDGVYRKDPTEADPTFNTIGWDSTYSGLPLPAEEMREWLTDTVDRILALSPRRVLEIGCGLGMLLFRLADRCESYWGTDVSGKAIAYVESQLARRPERLAQVQLAQRPADRFDGFAPGSFDTVVMNSVVQYFPSVNYLVEVLTRAVEAVRPGGAIFLGDLRSLPLLKVLHTGIELFQADPALPVEELRRKVQARASSDAELQVSPSLFYALQRELPRITRVEVYPRRGRSRNELTQFRYQVVLRVAGETVSPEPIPWLDWEPAGLSLEALGRRLREEQPALLGLRGVPNQRVAELAAAARLLFAGEEIATAIDLRERASVAAGVEPQDVWDLALELPYEIELGWASPQDEGRFDAVLRRRDLGGPGAPELAAWLPRPELPPARQAWSAYASRPLQGRFVRQVVPALRAWLSERLPAYMVPSAFVLMDRLPLTPNGKVDRRALPPPEVGSDEELVAPRTPVEGALARIWAELLGLDRVGVRDHFFEVGGHSLLATRVISRVRADLGVEIPLRDLFEAPTLGDLAARIEAARRAGAERMAPPLVPVARDGALPLSFAQQRLWFIDQLEPGRSLYNLPVVLRVEGPLDVAVLALCLGEIVRRHETLRTIFAALDGSPVQVIQPAAPFGLALVDLSGLPETKREATALGLAGEEAGRPFDLACGPLMRGMLLRLAAEDYVATLTLHHIAGDGWSTGILVREVTDLYAAFTSGRPSPLPELPVQYADFSVWQSSWLQGEILESEIASWRRQLAGLPPLLELPTDRPRPAVQSFRGAAQLVRLPAGLNRRAQALSRREGATLFMVLLAGFQTLLSRYSGQQDFAVGTPVAGRNRVETEGLIGFFVNTLVLRGDLSGEPSFRELLGRVRETALAAHTHQDVPFEKLVQELSPERSLAHTPLFQVIFVLQNVPVESLEIQNLRLRPVGRAATTAKFDLTLSLTEHGGELLGEVEHATDLFDATTIRRLILHYERLLSAAVSKPELSIAALPLLTDAEHHQLLREWGGMGGQAPATPTLHGGFEAQARRAPEAPALTWGDRTMSYGELNRRANQLARLLRSHGVAPEGRVGLCLERSPDLVVGLLGILKAGGAYVPLDPAYPQERLAYMIEDACVQVVVGTKESLAALPGTAGQILLDGHREPLEALPADNLEPPVDGQSLAYVIYTSGSTGRPKGTLVTHGNVVRLFDATQAWLGFSGRDVWTLFHSYAFDFSVWEIWGALLHGGRLVIVPYEMSRSPELFLDLLIRERVTVLNQTPSAFSLLAKIDEQRGGVSTDLRLVIFGGEALDLAGLAPWFTRHGDREPRLVNMYGITETTVHVTFRPLHAAETRGERRSVIGVPIPDLSLAVLDAGLRPVPIGVPGEIVVGGAGLARGYLGRPELTAERFVPDPAGDRPGARLYRSGDLGRFLPNGDVEYLGRIDHQVKIRGFRVELGEIEAALADRDGVREAVVVAREDGTGRRRLVAYVVAESGHSVGTAELRAHLQERLPEFMIPAVFVLLNALPLNDNGKVDRRALPEPDGRHLRTGEEFVAPETAKEKVLAEVWAEVLGVERVGAYDNFFHLGGDSIRSIVVSARAEKQGVAFSIQQLFGHPILHDLARVAESDVTAPGQEQIKPFALLSETDRARLPEGVEDAYPLANLQAGMLYHSELAPESAIYHDVFSFHLRGRCDVGLLATAVAQVVRRHPALRTSFDLAGFDEPLQFVHQQVEIPFAVDDLRHLTVEEGRRIARAWIDSEAFHPFDRSQAPLARFQVHLFGSGSFQFSFSFHHSILDGWSVASLLTELFRRYLSLQDDASCPEEAPPGATLHELVHLERSALASAEAREHWRRHLDGSPLVRLPRRRTEGAAADRRADRVVVPLPLDLSDGLKQVARSFSLPLKSVLMAVHFRILGLLSGLTDILSGVISNGRPERSDGEQAIGLFLNTLPLRMPLPGGTWSDLAHAAFELERSTFPFRRFPLPALQQMEGGRTLFEVAFNFLHFHVYDSLSQLSGLDVLSREVYEETDLSLITHFQLSGAAAQLQLTLSYQVDEHDREEMEEVARRYLAALEAMAGTPQAPYDTWSLFTAAERAQIAAWNRTAQPLRLPLQIHEVFAAQAERTPDAPAAEMGTGRLTYRELDHRAGRLARSLRSAGVKPDDPVGMFLERSLAVPVAVLGIFKAGGAYLPLDPAYPAERLAAMVDDARSRWLVCGEKMLDRLPAGLREGKRVLLLGPAGEIGDPTCGEGEARPVPSAPGHLAYVLYTSGSTGRPKGVAMPHSPLANMINWQIAATTAPGPRRVAQFSALSFDASVQEMLVAWAQGGTLVLLSEEVRRDARSLLRVLVELSIEQLFLPFVALQQLADEAAASGVLPTGLREVFTAGEQLQTTAAVRELFRRLPGCRLVNQYGPTEAHVVTSYTLPVSPDTWPTLPPIGPPIANFWVRVLDASLQPVLPGVPGELYFGGAGVARGYLGRPDLTAERFLPDPQAAEPGERVYRTGDLGRHLPDGGIEFLGRTDHQVKVRGFRVEPGEIEAALALHPAVSEAAVVVREVSGPGDRRLVGYVVPRGGVAAEAGDALAGELRTFLAGRLPEHMIPWALVPLDAFPLTPSGKLDRRSLPAPGAVQRLGADLNPPRGPIEERVAAFWSEVLGSGPVGVHESFFELGGHSLLATRVMSRLRAAFGIDLPLRALFEAPTVAGLAARVEAAQQAGADRLAPPPAPITPTPRDGALPLSFAQQRLWFIDQLEPGRPVYNLPVALRVEGPLDSTVLALCLGEIVRRHEALRTVFTAVAGSPVQAIRPAEPFRLSEVDLSGLPESRRDDLALTLTVDEAGRPFDLTRGPLLRGLLLRLSASGEPADHVVALTLHHIVSDGWSMGLLVREVTALYTAFAAGRPSPLPELPVQYADFAAWQHTWLHGDVLESELSYWRRQLAGLPPFLSLPTDRPRPAVQSFRGTARPVRLPAELTRRAEALSRREGATLFMVLLAGFQALLARYSGQDDLAVGSPVAGRNRVEVEGLIGFFVNTLVLRGDLSGDGSGNQRGELSFRELLGRARETTLAAHAHQDVPFEKLVQELAPERSLAHTPLFQVMFVLQNAPVENLEIESLHLRPLGGAGTTAKFDLTLSLEEHDGALSGGVGVATDLFDTATIDRLIRHYERLLTAALAAPERPLADLEILSPAERAQLFVEWNDTAQGAPALPAHHLIELQAERTPAAVAVRTDDGSLTYGELAARVRAWAGGLRTLGAGPEQVVAVCLERSADLVAALLAVLAAGAAYLPLDPRDPEERRVQILADARPLLLLTQRDRGAEPGAVRTLCVEDLPATADDIVPGADGPAGALAYVLYTSGSTGRPKGVAVDHAGLSVYLAWISGVLDGVGVRWMPLLSSVAFDASLKQLFVPLLRGSFVRVVSEDAVLRPARLLEILGEAPGAGCNAVPALWESLLGAVERGEAEAPADLHALFLGGERLPAELVARTRRCFPGVAVHNLYGPTEATANAAWTRLGEAGSVVLGRPVGGAHIVLTDRSLRPVPLGAVGELCVGGAGVARGYWGRPGQTAERFIPDPFGDVSGARLYRTGDLARQGADGTLRFVGRSDDQVKVRGVRIEPAEIEAALAAHPALREAAVVFVEEATRLVACVVPFQETSAVAGAAEALRAFLRERLPEAMVPAAFLSLGELPRTATGKVDRRRLTELAAETPAAAWEAPRTPVEEILAGIWAELLGRERVGATDHFFDLGGHSLLATRVMSRLRAALDVEMPLRDLFEAPTVAGLAARVEAARQAGAGRLTPPLVPVPREEPLALSFAQKRLWFIDQLEPGSPLYNMPVVLRLRGPLDAEVLALSLGEIVRRHEVLRTTFVHLAGTPVQRVAARLQVRLPAVDCTGLPEPVARQEARRLAREEALRPCDLAQGPLLRATLLVLGAEDHVFLLTLHHIVSDAWAMQVLVRELIALYEAFSQGQPSPLPDLPIQYADFAHWQRRRLAGEVLEEHLGYWKRHLGGHLPTLRLPHDFPPPAVPTHQGRQLPFVLPPGLSREIRGLARRENATLFMTLLAAFNVLLTRWTGQDDVVVGADISGRNRREVEGLIGFFINMLVLRTDLSGDPSFREILARVREVTLGGFAHQDLPYERLVEELRPGRSRGAASLFQAVFNFNNVPSATAAVSGLRRSGLEVSDYGVDAELVRFDFMLAMAEQGDVVSGAWVYSTELFRPETLELFHRRFETLLKDIVARPEAPLSELEIHDQAEREQRMAEEQARGQARRDRFLTVKPKLIKV